MLVTGCARGPAPTDCRLVAETARAMTGGLELRQAAPDSHEHRIASRLAGGSPNGRYADFYGACRAIENGTA